MTMRGVRKDPIFITSDMVLTLPAAGTSVADGGLVSNVTCSTDFEIRTGRSLRNATAARIWLRGYWFHTVTVTAPSRFGAFLGAIVLTEKVEDVDFPELKDHAGDWMLHDGRVLQDSPDTVPQICLPNNTTGGAVLDLDNRSKRLVRRDTDKLFIAAAKDTVTEETISVDLRLTVMWLVP